MTDTNILVRLADDVAVSPSDIVSIRPAPGDGTQIDLSSGKWLEVDLPALAVLEKLEDAYADVQARRALEEEYVQPFIDVYPVGLLADWKHRDLRTSWPYLLWQIKQRNWRSVKNYFNGYMAELQYGQLVQPRCGTGWTRRRALSSLGRILGAANRGGRS